MAASKARRDQKAGSTLYHYTTTSGLIGILESKSIWATGIEYLNDTMEFNHGITVVSELFSKLALEHGPGSPESQRYATLNKHLGDILKLRDGSIQFFVTSFSEQKDSLSQWQSYCANGGGFSIGFAADVLKKRAKAQQFQLIKCIYSEKQQRAICSEFIEHGRESIAQWPDSEGDVKSMLNKSTAALGEFAVPLVLRLLPGLKNPSFLQEKEWRLLKSISFAKGLGDSGIIFRPGKFSPIPFVEFGLAEGGQNLKIEEIVVGPNPDMRAAVRSVHLLLIRHNVECNSVVPYSGSSKTWKT